MIEQAQQPFQIAAAPPVKLVIIIGRDKRSTLGLILHHLVADMQSIVIFLGELERLYDQEGSQKRVALAGSRVAYKHFVNCQAERLSGGSSEAAEREWLTILDGHLPVLDLPRDHPRPSVASHLGSSVPVVFPNSSYTKTYDLARSVGVSPFVVLLSAFQIFLHRVSGQDDLLVGIPVDQRPSLNMPEIVGCCINSDPIRSFEWLETHGIQPQTLIFLTICMGAFLLRFPPTRSSGHRPVVTMRFSVRSFLCRPPDRR